MGDLIFTAIKNGKESGMLPVFAILYIAAVLNC